MATCSASACVRRPCRHPCAPIAQSLAALLAGGGRVRGARRGMRARIHNWRSRTVYKSFRPLPPCPPVATSPCAADVTRRRALVFRSSRGGVHRDRGGGIHSTIYVLVPPLNGPPPPPSSCLPRYLSVIGIRGRADRGSVHTHSGLRHRGFKSRAPFPAQPVSLSLPLPPSSSPRSHTPTTRHRE